MATYAESIRNVSTSSGAIRRDRQQLEAWVRRHQVQLIFMVRYALVCALISVWLPTSW